MRQIKFRGKRIDNGEWIEGYYGESFREISSDIKTSYIVEMNRRPKGHDIHKKTLGQFTGLTDKNGKEIYEGDIIGGNPNGYIKWDNEDSSYEVEYHAFHKDWLYSVYYLIEIIGNIHDNPELLNPQ